MAKRPFEMWPQAIGDRISMKRPTSARPGSDPLRWTRICWISFALICQSSSAVIVQADGGIELVREACKGGLDFASIKQFRTFIESFKALSEDKLSEKGIASKCIKQREAILDLEQVIVTARVCDYQHIDNLIIYHNKHLRSTRLNVFAEKRLTKRFFSKYAIQVAHTCKRNLIKNLEEGRELLRGQAAAIEQAKEKILRERPQLRSNIKLIEEQPDDPLTTNVKEKSYTEQTLGEYREALTRLKRPEDILTFERAECEKSPSRRLEIDSDEIKMFFKPALVCLNLANYYSGSILSVARLANYGYIATEADLDLQLSDSQLVKDWIVAVQVCEPMLFMRAESVAGPKALVDTCSERVAPAMNLVVFNDQLIESDGEKLDEWIQTSHASRNNAQAIMKTTVKRLAKDALIKRLSSAGLSKSRAVKLTFKMMANPGRLLNGLTQDAAQDLLGDRGGKRVVDTEALIADSKSEERAEQRSLEALVSALNEDEELKCRQSYQEDETAVSMDPVTTLISTLAFYAVTFTFEWIFFIVMTLAARICYRMGTNFDHLLKFPPKVLSWKDADFAKLTEEMEQIDEDDFFDYSELTPDEQKQRQLLKRVFGKPPPMMFKD